MPLAPDVQLDVLADQVRVCADRTGRVTSAVACTDASGGELGRRWVQTDGYSGAELAGICREAALIAMQENLAAETVRDPARIPEDGGELTPGFRAVNLDTKVAWAHFVQAQRKLPSRLDRDLMAFYDRYRASSALPSL